MSFLGFGETKIPETSPQTSLEDVVLKVRTEFAANGSVGDVNTLNLASEIRKAIGISGPERDMLMETLAKGMTMLKREEVKVGAK